MRPGPSRPCHLEAAAAAEDHVVLGHAHVVEADVHVAVRGVVVAVDLHAAQDLHALGPGRHQDLGVALVLVGLRVGADHDDVDLAARVAGAGGEPFLAVEDPLLAFEPCLHGEVGGVRGGDVGLGHHVGRADLALEQGLEPLLLLRRCAEALQHLHVAGVGGRAVECLGRQPRPAHLLGEIGVLHRGEAVALVGPGEPEVPQAPLARLGLEALADLLLALGVGPAVAALADLGLVLGLERHDLLAHHGANLLHQRFHLGRHAEIHWGCPPFTRVASPAIEARRAAREKAVGAYDRAAAAPWPEPK